MRSGNSRLFASILCCALAVFAAAPVAYAADEPELQSPAVAARPAPVVVADEPHMRDTVLAVGGGLLVVVLAALGLTITFRSLGADIRGRKRRYRRRTRREPRSA